MCTIVILHIALVYSLTKNAGIYFFKNEGFHESLAARTQCTVHTRSVQSACAACSAHQQGATRQRSVLRALALHSARAAYSARAERA